MTRPVVLKFGDCSVKLSDAGTDVLLPDGAHVYGQPHDTDEYRDTAQSLGYGDDTSRLNVDHETAHVALAYWLGMKESPVMRAVASKADFGDLHALEEGAVLAIQKFANAAGVRMMDKWVKSYAVD